MSAETISVMSDEELLAYYEYYLGFTSDDEGKAQEELRLEILKRMADKE